MGHFNWLDKCSECAFYSNRDPNGKCYHSENRYSEGNCPRWTCLGFRQDAKRRFWVLMPTEKRCGRDARYFQQKTDEALILVRKMGRDTEVRRIIEAEKRKEIASRIENVLARKIERALQQEDLDICFCNEITFDYRNEEGIRAIVHVKEKQR